MSMKWKKLFQSVSTKVVFIIVIMIFPLNLIAVQATNFAAEYLKNQARQSGQNLADAYMTEVVSRMENTQNLLTYFLYTDVDCIGMAQQKKDDYNYQSSKLKFYYKLRDMAEMMDGGNGYFYYVKTLNDLTLYHEKSGVPDFSATMGENIQKMIKDDGKGGWHIYDWENESFLMFFINQNDVAFGGWLNLKKLEEKIVSGIELYDAEVCFTEGEMEVQRKELIHASSSGKGIYLNIFMKEKEVLGNTFMFQRTLQIIAVAYLLLIPLLYLLLRQILLKPLMKINEAHRQMQDGYGDFRLPDKANSIEYEEVFHSFNSMADNIKELKIESYEKEIAKQEMELKNLQLQIRPHFLLNTFNLLFALAQRREVEAVKQIILYLSGYFRYIFRSEKELEIFAKERSMIEGYIEMASLRYDGNIEFSCDVDPEIEFIRLPPLLLHNFVENAVKYGVRKDKTLHISLTGRYGDDLVTFEITDDGNGMEQETLENERALISGEKEPQNPNAHIGILNSVKRLKHFYGENASVWVDSAKNEMTQFVIRFPYKLEVDDETSDC